jgi:hypothetical protein
LCEAHGCDGKHTIAMVMRVPELANVFIGYGINMQMSWMSLVYLLALCTSPDAASRIDDVYL